MVHLVIIPMQRNFRFGSKVSALLLIHSINEFLTWHAANYDPAMKVVAYTELIILARVVLGAITFQNAILAPIIFAHFLRQRYYQSVFTRDAITKATRFIDGYVIKANNPIVSQIYAKLKALIEQWVGSVIEPNSPQGARR